MAENEMTDGELFRKAIRDLLQDGRELSAGAIAEALNVRRPRLSHHLAVLLHRREIQCRPAGPNRFYSLPVLAKKEANGRVAPAKERAKTPASPFRAALKRLAEEKGVQGQFTDPPEDH
jgi:DNA-binding transcriptional ArsR family regulator